MKKIQHIVSTNKSLFILGGVLLVGLWFCFFEQSMFATGKHTAPTNSGIVALQSKTSSAEMPTTAKSNRAIIPMHAQHNVSVTYTSAYSDMPKAKMGSTSMRLHETSSANVHSIGSGNGNGVGNNTSAYSSSNGRDYIGLGYGGNMMVLSSSLALAAPGASHANEMANIVTTHETTTGPRRVNGDPFDPFLDPVGDVAWALIALLAATYAFIIYRRRTRA